MPTAHANEAAVLAAGYKKILLDRGASFGAVRWYVAYEKPTVGGTSRSGSLLRADAYADTQGNAETKALASLNSQRDMRYGHAAAGGSKHADGDTFVVDVS